MGPFHILLDQMGLDQMWLDKEGIHPRKSLIFTILDHHYDDEICLN